MLHTNCGELALLFDTYCRVWRAGGQASLTTSTKDGLVEANLKLQLGPPAAARAGAPPPSQRLYSPSSYQSQKNHGSVVALLPGKFLQKSGKFLR